MTSLAADHMGLADRGRIRPGAFADLVLFDPAIVTDEATTAEPHKLSTGIEKVWVNGELVYDRRDVTWNLPGQVLRRASQGSRQPSVAGR
jgi:N-acyl-D-amino-acid deacylase